MSTTTKNARNEVRWQRFGDTLGIGAQEVMNSEAVPRSLQLISPTSGWSLFLIPAFGIELTHIGGLPYAVFLPSPSCLAYA